MRLTGRGQRWPLYSYPRLARYAFFTGTTGLSRLARPAVLEVRPEAQPVPPDAGACLRQHGGHLRVPTHGVPGPPRDRREQRLQPARVRQRPRQLAQGEPDGGRPTRTAGPHDHSDAHGVAGPPVVEGCRQGSEAPRADAGEFDVPEGRARRPRRPGAHDSRRDDPRLAGRQHPRPPLPSVGSRLRTGPRRRHLRYPEDVSGRLGGVPGRDPRLRRASRRGAHDSAEAEERRTGLRAAVVGPEGGWPRRADAPMPHLDFAVCVEGELPCQYNYASKELEFFNANAGVWMHTGGQAYCRGELLKDALCKVLCTPRWGLDKDGKTAAPGRRPSLPHGPCPLVCRRHAGQGDSEPVPAGFGRQRQPTDAAPRQLQGALLPRVLRLASRHGRQH